MALVKSDLKACDIMTHDPVCVSPSATIRELAHLFEEHEISGAPVVDQSGKVVGIVTKTDLIRRCSEGTNDIPPSYLFEVLSEQGTDEDDAQTIPEPLICVEDFMTEDPLMVPPTLPVAAIARLMFDKGIHRVIVSDDEDFPIGIITSLDILGAFPSPTREPSRDDFPVPTLTPPQTPPGSQIASTPPSPRSPASSSSAPDARQRS